MSARCIDLSDIRRTADRVGLAGFAKSADGVELRKAGTPKISKKDV